MDIIDISIEHSLAMIGMMPINPKKLRAEKASCPYRVMDIMNNLSEQFSTHSQLNNLHILCIRCLKVLLQEVYVP